jgi:hypothetical protein
MARKIMLRAGGALAGHVPESPVYELLCIEHILGANEH